MKTEKDFTTIAEAVAYSNSVEQAFLDEQAAHNSTKIQLSDAETAAEAAIAKANAVLANAPKDFTTTVAGVGKVRVNFGVDKLTKDALLENPTKIAQLVKIKSHSVTVLEAEEAN